MSYHHHQKLSRLSSRLDELFSRAADCGEADSILQDLADEIAATAGEVMVELSDQRDDELVRKVIGDARRLREVVRTLRPETPLVSEAGQAPASGQYLITRGGRRAA